MSMSALFILIRGFLFSFNKKKFFLLKIFQLLIFFSFFIFLINGIGYGISQTIKKMAVDYYGDLQVVFKKKISQKESLLIQKKLEASVCGIQELFFYGLSPGIVCLGEDIMHQVYVLNYVTECPRIFLDKVVIEKKKNGFFAGKNIFSFWGEGGKKNILLFTERGYKKNYIQCDGFPVFLSGYYSFLSDEWNDKIIAVPNSKFEQFFEKKSIQYLQIYLVNKKFSDIVIKEMNKKYGSLIYSIKNGADISIENEMFSLILNVSIHLIIILFFLLSFFFLYFFMRMYFYENFIDYDFLQLIGVKKNILLFSLIFIFQLIVINSLIIGFFSGFIVIKLINYYHIINLFYSAPCVFLCAIRTSVLMQYACIYLVYTFIISFFLLKIILVKN